MNELSYKATTEDGSLISYVIFDALGNTIQKGKSSSNKYSKVSIKDISPGIYFLTVYFKNGTLQSRKFIKQ